jgi:hypothetical protein
VLCDFGRFAIDRSLASLALAKADARLDLLFAERLLGPEPIMGSRT